MTDRANGKALHQQWQGRGRAKQVLLSHPNMEVTETGHKTQARLWFVLKAQTRTKGAQLCFITEIVTMTKKVLNYSCSSEILMKSPRVRPCCLCKCAHLFISTQNLPLRRSQLCHPLGQLPEQTIFSSS